MGGLVRTPADAGATACPDIVDQGPAPPRLLEAEVLERITGYQHPWMLKAHLDEEDALAEMKKAARNVK